jgi:hypothetical protein
MMGTQAAPEPLFYDFCLGGQRDIRVCGDLSDSRLGNPCCEVS